MVYVMYDASSSVKIGWLNPIVAVQDDPPLFVPPGELNWASTDYAFPATWSTDARGYWWHSQELKVWVRDPGLPSPVPHDSPAVAANARDRRTALLLDCDWTQLPDVDLTSGSISAFATYRQALRDVPQQPGFPNAITWPVRPAEIKP